MFHRLWFVAPALVACATPAPAPMREDPLATRVYDPEEAGAIVEVANTATLEALDHDVPLDARAAEGIVARRPFGTVAEVDAVPYVGDAALEALLAYAERIGALDPVDPVDPGEGCLLLSEVIEGMGANNKAIELYNCGDSPLDLAAYGVCLVRNDDTSCTLSTPLPTVTLDPGEVHTACRTLDGTWMDPHPTILARCATEMPGTLNFNGDDRLVVYEVATDRVVDMLGRFGWVPSYPLWADRVLRRCNPEPWTDSGFYDTADFFTEHARTDVVDYGIAPVLDGCP